MIYKRNKCYIFDLSIKKMQLFGASLLLFVLFISLCQSYNHRYNSLVNLLKPNADANEQDDGRDYAAVQLLTKDDKKPDNILDDNLIGGDDEEKIDSVSLKRVVFKLREYVSKVMEGLTSIENKIHELPADSSDDKTPKQKIKGQKEPSAEEEATESGTFDGTTTAPKTVTEDQSDYELLGDGRNDESGTTTKMNCADCKHCCDQIATSTEVGISEIKRSFSNLVKKRERSNENWSKWSDWSGN